MRERKSSTHGAKPLAHADEPEPLLGLIARRIEPDTGVRDPNNQFRLGPDELDTGRRGTAVLYDVPECFLNDPEDA